MEKIEIIQALTGYNQHTCLDILNEMNANGLNYGLSKINGVGKSGIARLMAANEFTTIKEKPSQIKKIRCSRDIAILMKYLGSLEIEEFYAIHLNRQNDVKSIQKVSMGGVSGTITDIRIILNKAVQLLSSGLILCHNHPSGYTMPSEADKSITNKAKSAVKLFDISLLDHVIIAGDDYYSFADEGLI